MTEFGTIQLSAEQCEFYAALNDAVITVFKELPPCMHTDATLFMHNYSHLDIGDELDIFKNYYPPAWTSVFWLHSLCDTVSESEKKSLITSQAMAMYLHSIDDHLTDSEIDISAFTILLRSELWKTMRNNMSSCASLIPNGEAIAATYIDKYYRSNYFAPEIATLEDYCELFREQMATWTIIPIVTATLASRGEQFTKDCAHAYEAFGIAWRLLDDLQDFKQDFSHKRKTALFYLLPDEYRRHWLHHTLDIDSMNSFMMENNIQKLVLQTIIQYLNQSAALCTQNDLSGLADEFSALVSPLQEDIK